MTNYEFIKAMNVKELAKWLEKEVEPEELRNKAYWIENIPPESHSTAKQYKCSKCGFISNFRYEVCLQCGRAMQNGEYGVRGL